MMFTPNSNSIFFQVQSWIDRLKANYFKNQNIQQPVDSTVSPNRNETLGSAVSSMRTSEITPPVTETTSQVTIANSSSSDTISRLENDIKLFKKEIEIKIIDNKAVYIPAGLPKKILDTLKKAGGLEIQFITQTQQRAPRANADYLREKQKREGEISKQNYTIQMADLSIKGYTRNIGFEKNKITKLDPKIAELKEKLKLSTTPLELDAFPYDGHHYVINPEFGRLSKENQKKALDHFNLKSELAIFEKQKQTSEKQIQANETAITKLKDDKEKAAKKIEELKAQGPTEKEIELLNKAREAYKTASEMQKDLTKLFEDLIGLRKELDNALGRPPQNYKSYTAVSGTSNFTLLAQDLFGVTPIRVLGPAYEIKDNEFNIYFQPKVKKENQYSPV